MGRVRSSVCPKTAEKMRVSSWTVVLFVFSSAVIYGREVNAQDECRSQENCTACIRSKNCAWCNIVVDQRTMKPPQRCVNQQDVEPDWCRGVGTIENPSPYDKKVVQNRPLSSGDNTERIQIQPQIVKLKLRQGEEYHLKVKYRQAEDYPVDLYFLVDLSQSMTWFQKDLSELGNQIVKAMKNLTTNFRLGFGSFVDKNVRPITADRPWDPFKHYSYKNQMPLTDSYTQFRANVINALHTGNWDEPEGGLDGVMQAIVCTEEVEWRSDARHLLVYVSDERPHIAGDGRLGGVVEPNDEKCHLNKSGYYSHAELQDYPSLGQINWQARKNNINIIFATIADFKQLYDEVQTAIEGSSVGTFDKNSEKVIELISGQYEKLVKSLKMSSNSTSNFLDVKFRSKCLEKNGQWQWTNKCDGIRVNLTVEFDVVIKAIKCPENKADWHQVIQIKPEGINEHAIVEIDLLCDCNCTMTSVEMKKAARAEQCNSNGVLECGICSCDPEYYGNLCQCKGNQASSNADNTTDNCQADKSSKICSDRGSCVCGSCLCDKGLNSKQHFYGKFCHCDDFSCSYSRDGKLCGHGRCECGKCVCDAGWGGPACECSDDTSLCRPPGNDAKICSGAGTCECGQCKCNKEKGRNGRYCEDCPSCSSQRCDEFKDCVECKVHKSGKIYAEDPNCLQCSVEVTPVEEIEEDPDKIQPRAHVCRIAGDDGSTFVFTYVYGEMSDNPTIFAKEGKEFRVIDDFLAATLGVVLLTLLLGFLILLIWKITTWIHDTKEYDRFMNDGAQAQWGTAQNPLYRDAVTTFKNPAFYGTPEQDDF